MPLADARETVRAGPASRKRRHEEITRSPSRSVTPLLPSKRRRTEHSFSHSATPPRQMPSRQPSPTPRFVGDGLDFRRPTQRAVDDSQDQTLIDLTQDDDVEEVDQHAESSLSDSLFSSDESDSMSEAPIHETRRNTRTPWPNYRPTSIRAAARTTRENQDNLIDLTGDEDDQPIELTRTQDNGNSSDVEIVEERQAPRRPELPMPREIDRRLRTPPPNLRRSNAQSFADSLRPLANLFNFRPEPNNQGMGVFGGIGLMDQVGRIMNGSFPGRHYIPAPLDIATYDDLDIVGDYDDIQMNYEAPAFIIENPEADLRDPGDAVLGRNGAEAYKPPPKARDGFARDIDEDGDVLICVNCEEELAAGDEEDPQTCVFVSKKCGHVYCGTCAKGRKILRQGNERKRQKAVKSEKLASCPVSGCGQKLTAAKALQQIYL